LEIPLRISLRSMSETGQLPVARGVRPPYPGAWLHHSVRSCGASSFWAVRCVRPGGSLC